MRWAREESGVDTVNDLVAWWGRQRYPVRSDGIRSAQLTCNPENNPRHS
jgi:hypothetical protein